MSEEIQRFAVIGQPIAQSLSPRIHAAFAEATGRKLSYERIEIAPQDLEARVRELFEAGYSGLNVTMPHKLGVMAQCVELSARAELAGAANTLSRGEGGWRGDNTDGEGLVRDLRENLGVALAGQRVLVLGAGGAARGILQPLMACEPAELTLSSRNPWKPEALAEQFKAVGTLRPCTHLALKGDVFDVIINATPAGYVGAMPRLPGKLLAPGGVCYDLSYGEAHAAFAQWAEGQGAALIADGLGMLVEQAASSFEIWHGVRPKTAAVLKELRGT